MTGEPRAKKKRGSGESGAVLVESAITAVLLFVMLFGIIDFGRALYTYHFLANAAREATRWASVNGSSCTTDRKCPNGAPANPGNIASYVQGLTPPGISNDAMSVSANWPGNGTLSCPSGSENDGCPVQVQVSYNFRFLVPIVRTGSITMSSSSEMTISH